MRKRKTCDTKKYVKKERKRNKIFFKKKKERDI